MEKRGFHLVGSVWWGGVVLEGDPEDDAQLESFLRNQYRTMQFAVFDVAQGLGLR